MKIWIDSFQKKKDFDQFLSFGINSVFDFIDDRLLYSRHPFDIIAYCITCNKVTKMNINYRYCGSDGLSVNPAWTETVVCSCCGLNSRQRAILDFTLSKTHGQKNKTIYLAENTTKFYDIFVNKYANHCVVGSEYLGFDYTPGMLYDFKGRQIRHENLTSLSFTDEYFDLVITLDVFEHIPDYNKAFLECYRVLKKSGLLVFSVPFFANNEKTTHRAKVVNGNIEHILPPEYHGNPVSDKGSLCFQNFGWDLLDNLLAAGFSQANALLYWAPWQGHLGFPLFIFCASRA